VGFSRRAGQCGAAAAISSLSLTQIPISHRPAEVYGPPLPAERVAIMQQAQQLCGQWRAGRLILTNPDRDGAQLLRLEQSGLYCWPPPPAAPGPKAKVEEKTPRLLSRVPSRGGAPDLRLAPEAPPEMPEAEPPGPAPIPSPPSPDLLRMLNALAAHSTPAHPLELLSFLRPPYRTGYWRHAGPNNPHSLGMAVDIAMYAGHRVRQEDPEACVAATLALLRDLPPGRYRFGMPKAPEAPAVVGRPQLAPDLYALLAVLLPADAPNALFPTAPAASSLRSLLPSRRKQILLPDRLPMPPAQPADTGTVGLVGAAVGISLGRPHPLWPFFPAPEVEIENGVVAPLRQNGKIVLDPSGQPMPHILRFRNEFYAPATALADARLHKALLAARKRGVEVFAFFPDAADHIHIDVKQP
jgi:hypothetical protein